ncbi:hypothetical protein [Nocardia arizonensis]|uniref:hypothetical protein n=1 Tax=Nocardia arizonensis TaxID=1141647 RepID=UPI000AFA71CA|nr:hypothetical protein [Nocardia arizonensis]
MPELRVYEVEVNGWPTTLQLTVADAAARGFTDEDTVDHRTAVREWLDAETAERQRTEAAELERAEAERLAAESASAAEVKQATPANKVRTRTRKSGA